MIKHIVCFKLKDTSPAAGEKTAEIICAAMFAAFLRW